MGKGIVLNAKLICMAAGVFAGIPGIISGLVVGHMIDLFFTERTVFTEPEDEESDALRQSSREELNEAYRILGIKSGTPFTEVKRVFRSLAANFHPDAAVTLDEQRRTQVQEAFIRIRNAYEVIRKSGGK